MNRPARRVLRRTGIPQRRGCGRAIDRRPVHATFNFDSDEPDGSAGVLQNRAGLFLGSAGYRSHRARQFRRRAKARAAAAFPARQLQYHHRRAVRRAHQFFRNSPAWRKASSSSFSPTTISASITPSPRCPACSISCRKDPSVVGVTGAYAVEGSQGTSIVAYQNAESDDVVARVNGFLSYSGPNILQYAPMRREIVQTRLRFHEHAAVLLFVSRSDHLPALSAQRKIRPA